MEPKELKESISEIVPMKKDEVPILLELIKELARYEKLEHEVTATVDLITESIFESKAAECIFAKYEGKIVGYALFFHNYSTFLGKKGLYIEDIYVNPEYRKKGIGTQMFKYLGMLANQRNCGRMEWSVLDWNKSAIDFYKKFGAVANDDWTVYRITGEALQKFSL